MSTPCIIYNNYNKKPASPLRNIFARLTIRRTPFTREPRHRARAHDLTSRAEMRETLAGERFRTHRTRIQ
jgi:hypothetical protein